MFGSKKDDAPAEQTDASAGGTPSEGPSGLGMTETSVGGADSVPDTPDTMPPVERGAGPEASDGDR
jgi:hypothetical protein